MDFAEGQYHYGLAVAQGQNRYEEIAERLGVNALEDDFDVRGRSAHRRVAVRARVTGPGAEEEHRVRTGDPLLVGLAEPFDENVRVVESRR